MGRTGGTAEEVDQYWLSRTAVGIEDGGTSLQPDMAREEQGAPCAMNNTWGGWSRRTTDGRHQARGTAKSPGALRARPRPCR